jgi:hypothetical protein
MEDELVKDNKEGSTKYEELKTYGYNDSDKGFLSEEDFYKKINAGELIEIDGEYFSRDKLYNNLTSSINPSTAGSYLDYITYWASYGRDYTKEKEYVKK